MPMYCNRIINKLSYIYGNDNENGIYTSAYTHYQGAISTSYIPSFAFWMSRLWRFSYANVGSYRGLRHAPA